MPASIEQSPSAATALEEIGSHGALELLSGNAPYLLEGDTTAWLVESGTVEIFNVTITDGKPAGTRSHFMSIRDGALIFGMDLKRYGAGSGFLAVGAIGTRVRRLDTATLRDLARRGELAPVLAQLVDGWVETISTAVTRDIVPRPRSDLQIELNGTREDMPLEQGKRMRCKKGVVWIESSEGEYLYIGMADLGLNHGGPLFPLSGETWCEAQTPAIFRAYDTVERLGDDKLWGGLGLLHESICQCEFINKRMAAADELNRLRAQSRHTGGARRAALQELVYVLETPAIEPVAKISDDASAEAIFTVAQMVGRRAGIKIKPHPDGKSLEHIVKASRIRTRAVALRDDWWHRDPGPMYATLQGTSIPVALLPRSASVYEMVNPASGERVKMDAEVSARLNPFAIMFYRSFPDGPLDAWALAKFGAFGMLPDFFRIAVMGILVGILGMMTPYFSGQIYDWVIPSADRFQLFQFVAGLAVSSLAVAAFEIVRQIAVLRVEGKMDTSVQSAMWDRLLRLPTSFFRNYSSGDLASRAGGIDAMREAVAGVGVSALLSLISGSFNLFMMCYYSMKLTVLGCVLIFISVAVTLLVNWLILSDQRSLLGLQGRQLGLVFQLINGIAKLRVSASEDRAFLVWARGFAEVRRITYKLTTISNIGRTFNSVFTIITNIALYGFLAFWLMKADAAGGAGAGAAKFTVGSFMAFTIAFGIVLSAALGLSNASLTMLAVIPLNERLKPILITPPEVDEAKTFPGKLTGAIEMSHVNFRYREDGPLILKDVSLSIKPGEFVALVGPSGSGKSTILRLLLGFEKPETGSVSYDGQDLNKLDVGELRLQMGVVLQQSTLLPGDIFRNIAGVHNTGTQEDAWEAARMAGIEEDIKAMPMGLQTVVGESGGAFSGGQKQRLMIARAIFGRPRILFFDEATSALDNRTQEIVTNSLDRLQATRVVVAHRLSTIINADRIVVAVDGKIVQQGTYEELIQQEGPFAALAKRQIV